MAFSVRTKPLSVCITRCVDLTNDLNGIPQFQDLQQQVKALLSSLISMMNAVRSNESAQIQSDPTYSPGLSLLAAYLHELEKTCGYYGTGVETEWKLSDKDRAFILGEISNPFNRLATMLSSLAQTLQEVIDDEQFNSHTRIHMLCEWAESTFDSWDFFQGEFEAARVLAVATSAASGGQSATGAAATSDEPVDSCSDQVPQTPEPQKASAWSQIGEQLAQEGIEDDAIEAVANDLKKCARSLIRGESPRFGPVKHQFFDKTPASDNPKSPSASVKPSANKIVTSANAKPKATSAVLDDWFNRDYVSSKVTAALDRIKSNFNVYLPELLVVAFKQDTDIDSRNYRQALDLIYTMACHDTGRARLHARLAKEMQARTPARIRDIMVSKGSGTVQSSEGPVTRYLLKKCSADWDHGKYGRRSAETFALGLSRFIGELAKFGVFNAEHVHPYVRTQWGPTMKTNQFMAVYKLLRITGPMLDSQSDTSDMDGHFKRISDLVTKKKTPEPVKALAQELLSVRSSGWKSKQTKVMDQVEEAMKKA